MIFFGGLNPQIVAAENAFRPNDIDLESTLVFANYTDWDADGDYDDTFYELYLDFTGGRESLVVTIDIYLELVYPSETVATGNTRISVYATDQIITIFCLDSATEPGWYTVTVTTVLIGSAGGPCVSESSYIFDPPTSKGNGLPT